MHIRAAEPDDLAELVTLCSEHAAYEQASFDPIGKAERLAQALFSPQPVLFCLVVEHHDHLCGYSTYTFDYSTWDAAPYLHMDCLFLRPDARGFGIGQAIIQRLIEIAQTKGCCGMQWQTPPFNLRAINFYKRMGATTKDKVRCFVDF